MADLVEALERIFPGRLDNLRERLLRLDDYQDICDLAGFRIAAPAREAIPAMLDLAGECGA